MARNAFKAHWPWQTLRRVTSTNTDASGDPRLERDICDCPMDASR